MKDPGDDNIWTLRVWACAFFVGSLFAIPFGGTVGLIITIVAAFIIAYSLPPLRCPYCGKAVKFGAHYCHHCTRATEI